MAKIHTLDTSRVPVAPFSYTARVDHYWLQMKDDDKSEQIETIYRYFRNAPNLADVGVVLSHFDLAGYNMVKTAEMNRVIDWEYASIADPRLDLAISIHVAQQNPFRVSLLLLSAQRD